MSVEASAEITNLSQAWDLLDRALIRLDDKQASSEEVIMIAEAQTLVGRSLSGRGVGIERLSGTERLIMPSASNVSRMAKGQEDSK